METHRMETHRMEIRRMEPNAAKRSRFRVSICIQRFDESIPHYSWFHLSILDRGYQGGYNCVFCESM